MQYLFINIIIMIESMWALYYREGEGRENHTIQWLFYSEYDALDYGKYNTHFQYYAVEYEVIER